MVITVEGYRTDFQGRWLQLNTIDARPYRADRVLFQAMYHPHYYERVFSDDGVCVGLEEVSREHVRQQQLIARIKCRIGTSHRMPLPE